MSTLYPLKSLKYLLFVQSELLSAVTGFGAGARKAQLFIEMAVPLVRRRGLEPPCGLRILPEQLPQGLLSDPASTKAPSSQRQSGCGNRSSPPTVLPSSRMHQHSCSVRQSPRNSRLRFHRGPFPDTVLPAKAEFAALNRQSRSSGTARRSSIIAHSSHRSAGISLPFEPIITGRRGNVKPVRLCPEARPPQTQKRTAEAVLFVFR